MAFGRARDLAFVGALALAGSSPAPEAGPVNLRQEYVNLITEGFYAVGAEVECELIAKDRGLDGHKECSEATLRVDRLEVRLAQFRESHPLTVAEFEAECSPIFFETEERVPFIVFECIDTIPLDADGTPA